MGIKVTAGKGLPQTDSQKTQKIAEELWLMYYNDLLRGKGIVSPEIHRRMRSLIMAR